MLGQAPRELRQGGVAPSVGGLVSPDRTRIAFVPALGSSDLGREIWVIDSQGENPQKVLALGENEFFNGVHWSPDGQTLAYIRVQRTPRTPGASLTSLETSDLKGASRTVVVPVVVPGPFPWLESFCWLRTGGSSTRGRNPRIRTTLGKSASMVRRARPLVNQNASPGGRDLTLRA